MQEVYIIAGARTAVGVLQGSLSDVTATDLGVIAAKDLGLERDKTNVNGGAISIGHPLAASGARLTITLMYELRRHHLKYGAASLCIGGGQGIAAIIENVG